MRSAATVHVKQNGSIRDFYIKEALSYIEQNFQNDISVEDISAFCGLNRSYFGKIFHDTIGRSPQEFLISYRMTKAAELLKITSLSIADIGNAVDIRISCIFHVHSKCIWDVTKKLEN